MAVMMTPCPTEILAVKGIQHTLHICSSGEPATRVNIQNGPPQKICYVRYKAALCQYENP